MVGPAVKREGVAHLQAAMGLSERRACSIVNADRKMIRYRSCRPPDTELRTQLRDLANERKRFGYRRLFILLRQDGERSGINRIYRLYREEGLTMRKRRSRRRAVGTRTPILVDAAANARWSLDFVHDQFACGRRFRILNIVDDVTRECLAAIPELQRPPSHFLLSQRVRGTITAPMSAASRALITTSRASSASKPNRTSPIDGSTALGREGLKGSESAPPTARIHAIWRVKTGGTDAEAVIILSGTGIAERRENPSHASETPQPVLHLMKLRRPCDRIEDERGNPVSLFQLKDERASRR
jgi:helix-turn-helix protein